MMVSFLIENRNRFSGERWRNERMTQEEFTALLVEITGNPQIRIYVLAIED